MFVFSLCAYWLLVPDLPLVSDGQVMYAMARALAFDRTLALPEDYGLPQIRRGQDGAYYGQYDPGLPILLAPMLWLADQWAAYNLWDRYAYGAVVLRSTVGLGTVLGVMALYRLAATVYDPQRALWLALIAGFCTPLLVYARLSFAEGVLAGLVTLAVTAIAFAMFRFVGDPVRMMAREEAGVEEVAELRARLGRRNLDLTLSPAARQALAEA
ncbi:MAG: hypothetical protein HC915_19325, partial [Anaerolineae bacterium]|nr:hypothetical protein [Anaerolineae bacterium]